MVTSIQIDCENSSSLKHCELVSDQSICSTWWLKAIWKQQAPLPLIILRRLFSGLNCFIILWSILSVELTLKYNYVSEINVITSTGQLIPFIIGLVSFLRVSNAAVVTTFAVRAPHFRLRVLAPLTDIQCPQPDAELIVKDAWMLWEKIRNGKSLRRKRTKFNGRPGHDTSRPLHRRWTVDGAAPIRHEKAKNKQNKDLKGLSVENGKSELQAGLSHNGLPTIRTFEATGAAIETTYILSHRSHVTFSDLYRSGRRSSTGDISQTCSWTARTDPFNEY